MFDLNLIKSKYKIWYLYICTNITGEGLEDEDEDEDYDDDGDDEDDGDDDEDEDEEDGSQDNSTGGKLQDMQHPAPPECKQQ